MSEKQSEPVAWLIQYKDKHEFVWKKPEHLYEALACEPLYTTPHHASDVKQTKPLSDEEIKQIWNDNFAIMGNDLQFARAIESAHGIK